MPASTAHSPQQARPAGGVFLPQWLRTACLLTLALLLGAPYLVSKLGRGIHLPSGGVSTGLWLTWELTVFLASTAILVALEIADRNAAKAADAEHPLVGQFRWASLNDLGSGRGCEER